LNFFHKNELFCIKKGTLKQQMKPYLSGLKTKKPGYSFRNQSHTNLHINMVMEGSLQISIKGKCKTAKPGMLFFISPGTAVKLNSPDEGYTGVFAAFQPDKALEWVKDGVFKAAPDIYRLAQLILAEIQNPVKSEIETLPAFFELFACLALRFREKMRKCDKNYDSAFWANQVKRQINAHIYTPAKIEEIVDSIPLCKRQLFKHFRKHCGISIKQYQTQRKIKEARELLMQPGVKITDIAYELGFSSSQHFSTVFKKSTGLSPGEWLKQSLSSC
jgi:AraC-like DNA-binding protein/mannose-6-phosphate isomerase-like protein (cupin superfamily)